MRYALVLARACNWVAGSTTSAKAAQAAVLSPAVFYPAAISPPIRSRISSFFFFLLLFLRSIFLRTQEEEILFDVARHVESYSRFLRVFPRFFSLSKLKFEKLEARSFPLNWAKDAWRDPRCSRRETSNCVLYFTSAANYGKNNRSRARVSRRIRRSIRSTARASLFPCPDLIEETRCRERSPTLFSSPFLSLPLRSLFLHCPILGNPIE